MRSRCQEAWTARKGGEGKETRGVRARPISQSGCSYGGSSVIVLEALLPRYIREAGEGGVDRWQAVMSAGRPENRNSIGIEGSYLSFRRVREGVEVSRCRGGVS